MSSLGDIVLGSSLGLFFHTGRGVHSVNAVALTSLQLAFGDEVTSESARCL
jgi:hypothetical protein